MVRTLVITTNIRKKNICSVYKRQQVEDEGGENLNRVLLKWEKKILNSLKWGHFKLP